MSENITSKTSGRVSPKRQGQSHSEKNRGKSFRLLNLTIQNFKALSELAIEFPEPLMTSDPDIFVMGSKNGLGKTSILEACSMLFLAATVGEELFRLIDYPLITVDLFDLMIRAGAESAQISGIFELDNERSDISLSLSRKGKVTVKGSSIWNKLIKPRGIKIDPRETALRFFLSLAGLNSEPMLLPPFMYFHSYRKVQEGSPELGMMVEGDRSLLRPRYRQERDIPISLFKLEILRSLMSRGELFENFDNRDAAEVLEVLNNLVEQYAGGRIEKLRPSADSKIEFRVTPIHNPMTSFNFDGLSSGQKEIISTLFLIWHYTRIQPGIILIDEPELHLNAEWHQGFIRHLHELSPTNQYIIATHSEDVFSSVDKSRRILLVPDQGES